MLGWSRRATRIWTSRAPFTQQRYLSLVQQPRYLQRIAQSPQHLPQLVRNKSSVPVDDPHVGLPSSVQTLHPDTHTETPSGARVGSPSPWTSQVWDTVLTSGTHPDQISSLLSEDSVAIPLDHEKLDSLPATNAILNEYEERLQRRSTRHMGYPYNLTHNSEELARFMRYSINNLGDPFISSNYGVHSRIFEVAVVKFFANLWKAPKDEYWGYVTTCGTEGNLHAMLLARERHPDGIIYTSAETHYSIFKAANYYRMRCEVIPTLPTGEIQYEALRNALQANRGTPAIINVNIGTTVKGAVDDLDRILRIMKFAGYERDAYHIHCDGALFAMMMPFIDNAPILSFEKPIDSIAVSGHKMLGCPMPCGVALTRKEHVGRVEQRIGYLNSIDTTIMGSRNGHTALHMWHSLRKKGLNGIKEEVMSCLSTAMYLRDVLVKAQIKARLNDLSSTVVFERPVDDDFVKRWQLACEEDIAHVVVMPNVTKEKVDIFVAELLSSMQEHGKRDPLRDDSPLALLNSSAWGSA